jgi:hypothetical protein
LAYEDELKRLLRPLPPHVEQARQKLSHMFHCVLPFDFTASKSSYEIIDTHHKLAHKADILQARYLAFSCASFGVCGVRRVRVRRVRVRRVRVRCACVRCVGELTHSDCSRCRRSASGWRCCTRCRCRTGTRMEERMGPR